MASDLSSPNYGSAIASVESGGRYDLLGPQTKGDRAYGKYQIMGNNIGPWSQEILGQAVTPDQFLANPQLQDAIFQGKFGQYVAKYGPEGAARAWFAGEGGMNNPNAKDVLGTTVSGYGAKFMKALGAPQAPEAPPVTQGQAPVPVLSSPLPAYGFTPNNAPAGISGAQPSPQQAPEATASPQMADMAHMLPVMGAPRRPPDLTQFKALLARSPGLNRGFSFSRIS